jgi:ElaA protein
MSLQWQTASFAELSLEELYAVLRLRQEIFVVEQHCVYLDLDGLDQQATHMLCKRQQELVAYQRCLPPGACYAQSALGRIVVRASARGSQLGREIVQRGIDFNCLQWPGSDIRINAQAHLEGFYSSLGFIAEGAVHIEDGIPHQQMRFASSAAEK